MEDEVCDLEVLINGRHKLLLHQSVMCGFSGRLRTMVAQETTKVAVSVKLDEFPGGGEGFELVTRFCYNNGVVPLLLCPSNLPLMHCAAVFLEMTEEVRACNLLAQTEEALAAVLSYWTWHDVLAAIKCCESFFSDADALLQRLIPALFAAVGTPNDRCSSSSSSSPDTVVSSSPCFVAREWWFDDMTSLSPATVEKVMRTLGCYDADNKNLLLTRFLLHYLRHHHHHHATLAGLADTAVHGVISGAAFSCRGLFWVLRIVSAAGVRRECRKKLERVMGMTLDHATLDDVLVSGNDDDGGVYDVSLVMRLVRVFVVEAPPASERMMKVGRLLDKYLGEISPDQGLKVSKFLAVAESLPDSARECYDGVYRALDIYLESHTGLTIEERSTLCRCLNYEKLTLEACKDLAKNRHIPAGIAVQAMSAQQSNIRPISISSSSSGRKVVDMEKEALRMNLKKMQVRMVELEQTCTEMRGHMSKMIITRKPKSSTDAGARLPWMC